LEPNHKLRQLKQLLLQDNQLSGPLLEGIGKCSKLQQLNLSHNSFEGTIPTKMLARLAKLQLLDLSHCKLEGRLPDGLLGPCPLLSSLVLCNNAGLNGPITAGLFEAKGLKLVRLQECDFEGAEHVSELLAASRPAVKFEF
jgi:Leucine-rich repeat (LRR) protein